MKSPYNSSFILRRVGSFLYDCHSLHSNRNYPTLPGNDYLRYGPQEISRLHIIRMLSRSGFSMSAILRMLIKLDQGERTTLRQALDTPRPDEDVFLASQTLPTCTRVVE